MQMHVASTNSCNKSGYKQARHEMAVQSSAHTMSHECLTYTIPVLSRADLTSTDLVKLL